MEEEKLARQVGFNGAAIDRSRKFRVGCVEAAMLTASMGPRSIDRGNNRTSSRSTSSIYASMGPRSIDRGNMIAWLRALLRLPLQWGRDRSIAEIWNASSVATAFGPGFNGAAIDRSRK